MSTGQAHGNPVRPDVRDLHARAVVADMHNDLLMSVVARPAESWASFFREAWLPQLRDGGVGLQVLPVFIDDAYRPEGSWRQTLRMIEAAHRLAEGNAGEVALCRDGAEIDAAIGSGRIALVLALESCPAIETNVELMETLFRLGVRIASLAHFGRTALADGSGEDATGGRLTRAGVRAVAEMERLGMLFDVSHLGAAGVEHVLELATRPVIATHSSARALRDHHRNLTDDQLKGIAGGGGVVCVNFFAGFLDETEPTMRRLGDHIEHVVSVAGADHVGLGPDFMTQVLDELIAPWCEDLVFEGVDARACVPGLEGPRGLPLVTEELVRRGFAAEDITKILGGNAVRLLRSELARPARS
ncbi:MAG: Membrane dipeptidase [Streptosporangiaceae bacterium]|nr:Membrane dipeptidase [Streptosporangiaceae bacterium]